MEKYKVNMHYGIKSIKPEMCAMMTTTKYPWYKELWWSVLLFIDHLRMVLLLSLSFFFFGVSIIALSKVGG